MKRLSFLVNVYYMCKQIHGKNCKTVMLSHLLLYVCTCIKKNWKCFLPKKKIALGTNILHE